MKGLENAIRNLNSLDTRMVPQASAWAINRVAQKAVSVATRQVAGNTVAGDNQVKASKRHSGQSVNVLLSEVIQPRIRGSTISIRKS